jgi:hypothetical protein
MVLHIISLLQVLCLLHWRRQVRDIAISSYHNVTYDRCDMLIGLVCSFKFKVADDPPNSDYEW